MYQLHAAVGSSHRILSGLATSLGLEPVLDVGAAEGYLGRLLEGSGLSVDAVEPNPTFAGRAHPYYRKLYAAPVETVALDESYGTIVLGDVLEHLSDPLGALLLLKRYLKPEGVMLISLPNVAHLSVRLLLLSGRFPPMDRGPLDRTHLHFYTRSTAEQLLGDAGLRIRSRRATVVPLADIFGGRWRALAVAVQPLQQAGLRLMPGLFAYQWVFVASADSREVGAGQLS